MMVTHLNRKSLTTLEKSGHHNVTGKNQEVSGVVHSACQCVMCQQMKNQERESEMHLSQSDVAKHGSSNVLLHGL